MHPTAPLLPLCLSLLLPPTPGTNGEPPGPDDAFAEVWHDGRAEVGGYRWRGERYGELRTGEAIAIFVTEPFGTESLVKVDRPEEVDEEVVTALKLNLVRDFQTGLYDYDTMVSLFVRADDFALLKTSFTSTEWCGQSYEEIAARPGRIVLDLASYFQGESGRRELSVPSAPQGPAGAEDPPLVGEQLLVWLRALRGDVLEPGETRSFPFLSGAFERRLRHAPAAWGRVEVTRRAAQGTLEVPAGAFRTIDYELEASDGRTGSVTVESAYPHRILQWKWERDGHVLDSGTLLGSARLAYWELHGEGQEALRERIGLEP